MIDERSENRINLETTGIFKSKQTSIAWELNPKLNMPETEHALG